MCTPVTLKDDTSELDVPVSHTALKPGCVSHCSVVIDNNCYQFSLSCQQYEGMLIVCVKNRYLIHNFSKSTLIMFPLMLEELQSSQVCINGLLKYILSNEIIYPMSFMWALYFWHCDFILNMIGRIMTILSI